MQLDFTNAPEVQEANQLAQDVVATTSGYKVTTPDQYTAGGVQLTQVKGAQKRLEALRTSITGPLNASLKAVNDLFRAPGDRLAAAERTIKAELARFADEQERIQREEQRKLDEAAAKERARLQAIADEAARKARAEQARLRAEAEAAAAAGRAEEAAKLAAQATRVEEKAAAKVDDFENRAAMQVAPVIQREPPKVQGVNMRDVWKFEIVDATKVNAACMMPDEKKIGALVRSLQGGAAAVVGEGVRIYKERQVASGAA